MINNKPTILIIIGISGDLSKRKLLPAIGQIAAGNKIPSLFKIVGVTRQSHITLDDLLNNTTNKEYLIKNTEIFEMDLNNISDYDRLSQHLIKIENDFGEQAQYLFYLSVPPTASKSIIEMIGKSGLSDKKDTKLLLEKPFGVDLESAKELADHINKYFKSEQVYRIDHYLAKETAQNIIVFREGNSLFKKTWNKDFIDRIEIIVSEKIGIEGRASFYEQTGALRDFMQNHLAQLLALTLMEIPDQNEMGEVPKLRLKALKSLSVVSSTSNFVCARRGQYNGYKDEVKNKESMTETFASVDLESSDPNWQGVKMTLTTGKGLNEQITFIRILYKKDKDHESNELLLTLQPNEGISFSVWVKHPGYEHEKSCHSLDFVFKEHYPALPEAYEQVLFNAINSDHNLFTSGEEVIEAWRILDPVQQAWSKNKDDLIIYEKGSSIDDILK